MFICVKKEKDMPQLWDTDCRSEAIKRDNLLMDSRISFAV